MMKGTYDESFDYDALNLRHPISKVKINDVEMEQSG